MVIDVEYYGFMPYKNKEKERTRGISRRAYFRNRLRKIKGIESSRPVGMSPNIVGRVGERLFLGKVRGASWVGRPYDGKCYLGRVDVKTAKPTNHKNGQKKWKFHLSRQRRLVDSFILFCLGEDLNTIKVLVVPDKELTVNDISILVGSKSKYDKYCMNL